MKMRKWDPTEFSVQSAASGSAKPTEWIEAPRNETRRPLAAGKFWAEPLEATVRVGWQPADHPASPKLEMTSKEIVEWSTDIAGSDTGLCLASGSASRFTSKTKRKMLEKRCGQN